MTTIQPVRVMVAFGTRPEVLKLAPVLRALQATGIFEVRAVSIGQHREMLAQSMADAGVEADVELDVMMAGQSLGDLTGRVLERIGPQLDTFRPDVVVVQGDTTSAFAVGLASFYAGVPLAHVEAGLRTEDRWMPFPEEANRRLISRLADLHFCPTAQAADNLRREGVAGEDIWVTGNTVVDQLHWVLAHRQSSSVFVTERTKILVTLHRRETQGEVMANIGAAIGKLGERGDVEIVLPLHLSPTVRRVLVPVLAGAVGVKLMGPLSHSAFVHALRDCDLVLTDSGGVQEEAPSLGKPVIVLREVTERTEGVDAGVAVLAGTDPERIISLAGGMLERLDGLKGRIANPYGDGRAALRVVSAIGDRFGGQSRGKCLRGCRTVCQDR